MQFRWAVASQLSRSFKLWLLKSSSSDCCSVQNAGKKIISQRGTTLSVNVEQQFKDKSHNAFSKQCRSFLLLQYEWMSAKLYYWIHLVKLLIKILSLHLSYRLHIRLACISDCSYGLQCGIWHFVVASNHYNPTRGVTQCHKNASFFYIRCTHMWNGLKKKHDWNPSRGSWVICFWVYH